MWTIVHVEDGGMQTCNLVFQPWGAVAARSKVQNLTPSVKPRRPPLVPKLQRNSVSWTMTGPPANPF